MLPRTFSRAYKERSTLMHFTNTEVHQCEHHHLRLLSCLRARTAPPLLRGYPAAEAPVQAG